MNGMLIFTMDMVEDDHKESSNITSMRLISLLISCLYRSSINIRSLRFRKRGILGTRQGNVGVFAGFGGSIGGI
jgi:hypothetical protein